MQTPSSFHDVTVPGIGRITYAQAGSGPPVLLLHGLGATHAIWRLNIPALAQDHTVYAPDLPGHGDSASPKLPYTLNFGVRFAAAFMDAAGLDKVALVGSSMGGLLALATAVRHPQRIQALALADPAGLGRELARPMRLASVPLIGPILAALEMRFRPGLLPSLFHHPDRIDPDMAAEINRMASAPGIRSTALNVLRHGVSLGGLKPSLVQLDGLRHLSCPVFIVWGAEDRIIPVAHTQLARQAMPSAQVHVLPECSHLPFIEKPQAFNSLLTNFLGEVRLRQAAAVPAPPRQERQVL